VTPQDDRRAAGRGATTARGHARRERILHAAKDAFGEYGYRACSLASIAARAGLSEPGLLHYFTSKEQLLLDVLEMRQQVQAGYVRSLLDSGQHDMLDALLELCRANAADLPLVRLFVILGAESVQCGHPSRGWFVERYRQTRQMLAGALAAEQRRGLVAPTVDTALFATQIIGMWDGLQLQWLLDPGEVDIVAVFGAYFAQLRALLAPSGGGVAGPGTAP
jgi:AcrR family transcriptional regulator